MLKRTEADPEKNSFKGPISYRFIHKLSRGGGEGGDFLNFFDFNYSKLVLSVSIF